MAQQIALQIHFKSARASGFNVDRSFICHYSSHLLLHENDAYSELLKMVPLVVEPTINSSVQHPLTFEEVRSIIESRLCSDRILPCCVVLECPHRELGGKVTSYADLELISNTCRSLGVAVHMDGARLWEALAYYTSCTDSSGNQVTAAALCGLFDSIYVSCYKGLGGITGSLLLGSSTFTKEARIWTRRYGGNCFTLLPYALSSYSCYKKYVMWNNDDDIEHVEVEGLTAVPYSMKARLARLKSIVTLLTTHFINDGNNSDSDLLTSGVPSTPVRYLRFDPPVPQVCLIHVYIAADVATATEAHEMSKAECGIACFAKLRPIVIARATPPAAAAGEAKNKGYEMQCSSKECFFEFNLVKKIFSNN